MYRHYLDPIRLPQHDLRGHGGNGAQDSVGCFSDLLGEAEVCNFVDSIVAEDIGRFEVTMDDAIAMHFLHVQNITAMPLIICLIISIAYCSGIRPLLSISLSRFIPLQYSSIIIFSDEF